MSPLKNLRGVYLLDSLRISDFIAAGRAVYRRDILLRLDVVAHQQPGAAEMDQSLSSTDRHGHLGSSE